MFEARALWERAAARLVFVKDLARINMFFAGLLPEGRRARPWSGECGTGEARTFKAVCGVTDAGAWAGQIEYIPFPGD